MSLYLAQEAGNIIRNIKSDNKAQWVAYSLVTTLYFIANSVYADIHVHQVAS